MRQNTLESVQRSWPMCKVTEIDYVGQMARQSNKPATLVTVKHRTAERLSRLVSPEIVFFSFYSKDVDKCFCNDYSKDFHLYVDLLRSKS